MSLLLALTGTAPAVVTGGIGRTLAYYEAQWARRGTKDAPAKERRQAKRQAARAVYFPPPLPDVAREYVERLKTEREEAKKAEFQALMDLASKPSEIHADIARAAVLMAQRKQAAAAQALEEFDVMYVAAILGSS